MKKALLKTLYFVPLIFLSFSIIAQVDDPKARMAAEIALIKDPATGKIPIERLIQAREEIKKRLNQNVAIGGITWNERGPNNIGGRTRAVVFDPNDATAKKVWAGGVGGGLWYNTDITSATTVWQKIDDFWANLAISSIVFDPANTQNIYVGTGEGWFNGDSQQGNGIWKSSNGGTNWTQLASTASNTDFNYVQKIIVNSTGAVFAATQGGVYKSTDGGATWTINLKPTTIAGAVSPVNNFAADLEIGTDGVIYASFGNAGYQGSRVFKTADAGTTWTQITSDAAQYRTEIALAPSTSGATQVIYAITQSGSYTTAWLRKSTDAGATWTDATPSSSLTGNQAWYDLILAVKPNDPNVVIGGGNVIGRTTNGSTWITRGYFGEGLHPDHHAIVFRPGFPNEVVHGNDGGVYYSPDYGNAATVTPTFNMRNNGFNVTQYYGAAIKNIAGDGYVLAGSQDNGTHRINSSLNTVGAGTSVTGGDGMLCFIDQDQPDFQITSYQVGSYNFYNAATNAVTGLGISGTQFVGPSDYNSNQNVLYAERSNTTINRVAGIGGATSNSVITHTSVGGTSLIRCGLTDNTVYVGGYNGSVIKIINAGNVGGIQATTTIATGFAGVVSCVEIGATENELLVTRSNYGVKSVHYTIDGGATWTSKDEVGYGLPDIPVRFALFNPANRKQVLLATELGVFSTTDVTLTNPGWEPTNAALANVSCYMLRYRASDGTVAVATHGRGVYTTNFCAFPTINSPSSNTVCSNQPFNYTATTGSAGTFTFAWTRAAIAGISNAASSGSNANVNETLINTTTNPITVTYLFTISPNPCGGLVQQAVNVTVNPTVTPTVASYSVCQNGTVPSGQGLVVPAFPPSNTINGLLTNSSPTYVRPSGDNVTTYVSSGVTAYYQTFTFVATASGNTIFETIDGTLTGDPYDTYMSLYQTSFNAASPATNFLRGDDDSGALTYSSKFTHSLVAGTTYVIVVSTYTSGATGTFTLGVSSAIFPPLGTNNWYTAASGGSVLTTGEIFNPVGLAGSGVPNTATAGTTTFYVANALYPSCRTAATFSVVAIPTVTPASNSPVTVGGTINLTATTTGATFLWTGPNSFSSTDQNPNISSATTAMAGVYTISVTSSAASCVATATTNVVVNPVPTSCTPPTGATAGSNSPVTVGGTISLTSSSTGGTSQLWAGPSGFNSTAQNPSIASATAGMAGIYTVTITSSGTCTATATTNVVINPLPTSCTTPTATASSNSPICAGTPLNLTATCTGSISATLNGASQVPTNASTATGSVTGTFDPVSNLLTVNVTFNGLSAAATAAHIHSGAVGVNGPVTIAFTGFPSAVSGTYSNSFTLTAPQATTLASGGFYVNIHNSTFPGGEIRGQIALSTCTFAWIGVNGFSSTAQNPTIPSATPTATGTYQVIVTAVGGCTAMATTSATVNAVLVGGTINLTSSSTGGTSQVWAGPSGFNSTAQNPTIPSAIAGMAGVYTVTITSSGTCTATATTNVSVVMPPTATVVFVNIANAAAPTQDGNSWATAYGNLQSALALAPANSEIWVAQGIYKPTNTINRTIAFNIPSGAMLFGGFAGTEVAQNQRNFMTNPTILSGEIGLVGTVSDNSYHVVTFLGVSNSTVLDGFTVMAGNANLTSDRTHPLPGPTVQPLSINDGGGIGLDDGSSPMIINCRIISNDAIQGGGLFATNSSNPTVKNSTFMNNQATFGGATYHLGSNPVYTDVLIAGNKATGGAMYNNGANPTVTNVTMAGNGGVNGAVFNSSSTPVIKNSILWGNITPFNDIQSIISYSIVEGGYPGVGNLNLNPQFVNLFPHGLSPTLSGDYKLTNTSPAIDAGDNGMIGLTDKDLMGNLRRFNGGIVDIGAYEFQGSRIGGTVTSIISGNWEMGTTWDVGRKPLAGDTVIINNNHIVTVNANGVLKNIELRPNAKVIYSTAGIKLQTGF
jgi:CHRD domain